MRSRSLPAVPLGPGRACVGGALVLCAGLLAALPARAESGPVVIPDPTASLDSAEQASAVSLLVRSLLKPGPRAMVPRRELALAIESVTGLSPEGNLEISHELAPRIMERLGADSVVLWEFHASPKDISAVGALLGSNGKRLLRLGASAAPGDVHALAQMLVRKLAPAIGATLGPDADVGLAELRPFMAAEAALMAGDGVAISRAIELALPSSVARLSFARDLLAGIAKDAGLPALPRAQASLLRGDLSATFDLAEAGLVKEARNFQLQVIKARVLAMQKKFDAAEAALAQVKASRNLAAIALAQVVLAVERGDPPPAKDEALSGLLGRPAAEWRKVLPVIAATPAGSFGPGVEAAALAAAEKLSLQEPGLASLLATRALAAGVQAGQVAPLIRVQDLSAAQIAEISAHLAAAADSASASHLREEIKIRQAQAKEIASETGPEKPSGPPSALASNLLPVLQGFDGLYEPSLTSIQIAGLPGSGQPFYWPFLVNKQRFAEGLLETLMRSPWELQATRSKIDAELLPPQRLTDEGIANLAHDLGCNALLLYRIQPADIAPWVSVELVLYNGINHRGERIERIQTSMVGRSTRLVSINPLLIGLAALLVICVLLWLVMISLRGTVVVRVQWDADAKDEMFTILISRSPHTPVIENVNAYRKKMEWIGRRKRRFEAWNIDQNTSFRSIPRGKWYVHLYGIYVRGRQTFLLHEPPQEVVVSPRKTAFVAHVLEAVEAEFKLTVVDNQGPVEGARIWLDDQRARAVAAAKDGTATIKVPKGLHTIYVTAHGITVERPYQVVKAKVHEMTINLVWERRQEFVSRALERQVDDAAPYLTQRPSGQGQVSLPGLASKSPAAPSGGLLDEAGAGGGAESQIGSGSGDAIEIRLEDTPIVDLVPPPARVDDATSSPTDPPALAPVPGRLSLSLKPLAPEGEPELPGAPASDSPVDLQAPHRKPE